MNCDDCHRGKPKPLWTWQPWLSTTQPHRCLKAVDMRESSVLEALAVDNGRARLIILTLGVKHCEMVLTGKAFSSDMVWYGLMQGEEYEECEEYEEYEECEDHWKPNHSKIFQVAFRDPHLLEGAERRQNGTTNPHTVLSLRRSHHFDLHGGRCQGSQLLGHALSNSSEHGGTTGQDHVGVEILSNIDVTPGWLFDVGTVLLTPAYSCLLLLSVWNYWEIRGKSADPMTHLTIFNTVAEIIRNLNVCR